MKSIRTLEKEHKVILMVVDGAEKQARRIEAENRLDRQRTARMIDFFRNFVSACHHAKEEDHLFARMRERNLPDGSGLIDELQSEHEQGRRLIGDLEQNLGDAEAGEQNLQVLGEILTAYAALVRRHIDKENHILFPLADRLLTREEDQALTQSFERIEEEKIGPGVHEKYHDLARELAEEA